MGCWAAPTTKKQAEKLVTLAKKLELCLTVKQIDSVQKKLWSLYGDDMLMDEIDMAVDAIESEKPKSHAKFYLKKASKMARRAARQWKIFKALNE